MPLGGRGSVVVMVLSCSLPQNDEKVAIFRILAAILHLGNICFSGDTVSNTHTHTHAFEVAVVAIIRLAPFATSSATPTVHPHYLCVLHRQPYTAIFPWPFLCRRVGRTQCE